MLSMDKISGVLGFMIINEDGGITASGGALENSEYVANVASTLVNLFDSLGPYSEDKNYHKITITYKEYSYVISLSNNKTYIVKRSYQKPNQEDGVPEQQLVDLN